ncbi:oligopeptide/dipeptide ABC transporter ATP-binding protein [Devosia sp. YR412]|uniref:ABC transporter ATP-binding protein n=1 Tax=Devosia sp. YR412 TaxID=1881030 RepID=UPI001AECDC76|nr:oligopeptide/dipeptide ABC transporter ATP-binding protein [Devosia sp. YR412]
MNVHLMHNNSASNRPVLEVANLKKHFVIGKSFFGGKPLTKLKAVDGVSFAIGAGKTLGLVGESGCGKSTVGKTILRLYNPTEGSIRVLDQEISALKPKAMRDVRRSLQMIFQDPYASLDPQMTVGRIISEALEIHGLPKGQSHASRVKELLSLVGLDPVVANRRPKEFSGGQRQRIGIARALAVEPKVLVCDEPISALDVSIQAQVINLLQRLQDELGLTYLFIAHDLGVVRHFSDRVAVMYLGGIVEIADRDRLYADPLHPYTKALLSAIPVPDPDVEQQRRRILLRGELPSPLNPPLGCRFHTRCPFATDRCREEVPALVAVAPGQEVACHYWQELRGVEGRPNQSILETEK